MRLALPAALALLLPLRAPAAELGDVPARHWAREAVLRVLEAEVLEGYEGKFYGQKLLTRYQLAAVLKRLVKAAELPVPDPVPPPSFPDLPADHWAKRAVDEASGYGLLPPWSPDPTRVEGERLVDRYQLAQVVASWLRHRTLPGDPAARPADVPAEHPAAEAVTRALGCGALASFAGKFHGDKLVNRYQLAVVLDALLRGEPPAPPAPSPEDDPPPTSRAPAGRSWLGDD